MFKLLPGISVLVLLFCSRLVAQGPSAVWEPLQPVDKMAGKETVQLFNNLKKLLRKGIMIGHQDDLAYGVGWKYVAGKSDVKEITGDYPAVYGWELGNIEHDSLRNIDGVPFSQMRQFIQDGYRRGGVITISWHGDNPLTGGFAWDTTSGAVTAILPGGSRHMLYNTWLDKIAAFLASLKGPDNEQIPILFRPYHELGGSWFWWGKQQCTPEEFKAIWRYTLEYLRDRKGLHHLLYVFNSNDFSSEAEFLERYPGDAYADVLSFDCYQYNDPQTDSSFFKAIRARCALLDKMAGERNKIPALAETGYEAVPYAKWFTETLWKATEGCQVSYILLWRNHGLQKAGNWHYYVPQKKDAAASDFKKMYGFPRSIFEKEAAAEKLYK